MKRKKQTSENNRCKLYRVFKKYQQNLIFILLIVTTFAPIFLMFRLAEESERNNTVPLVLLNFFDEFLNEDYSTDKGLYIFPKYFYDLKDNSVKEGQANVADNLSVEQDLFEQVVYKYGDIISRYEVEPITGSFFKITLYNANNETINPPVGLWCTIEGEYISTWRIARLQPFSTKDAEYSDKWGR